MEVTLSGIKLKDKWLWRMSFNCNAMNISGNAGYMMIEVLRKVVMMMIALMMTCWWNSLPVIAAFKAIITRQTTGYRLMHSCQRWMIDYPTERPHFEGEEKCYWLQDAVAGKKGFEQISVKKLIRVMNN